MHQELFKNMLLDFDFYVSMCRGAPPKTESPAAQRAAHAAAPAASEHRAVFGGARGVPGLSSLMGRCSCGKVLFGSLAINRPLESTC